MERSYTLLRTLQYAGRLEKNIILLKTSICFYKYTFATQVPTFCWLMMRYTLVLIGVQTISRERESTNHTNWESLSRMEHQTESKEFIKS